MLESEGAVRRNAIDNREESPLECCKFGSLQNTKTDDARRAITDAIHFRYMGMNTWHSHIKVLYLCSLPRSNSPTNESWPTPAKGNSYILPSCRSKMRLHDFSYVMGMSNSTFYRISKSCSVEPFAATDKHKLFGKVRNKSNKMSLSATNKMTLAINKVLDEIALDLPWSTNLPDEVSSKLLASYFSKERLFTDACMELEENDHLSRTSFYRLLDSKEFTFLKFSKREKRII